MPVDPAEAARRAVEDYETHVRNQARARIGSDLARIQAQFRAEVEWALTRNDPAALKQARRTAASSLRALRPAMGPLLRAAVDDGVRIGAGLAGGPLPAGVKPLTDPAIKVTLARLNTPIRRHARLSANAVLTSPLRTATQLEAILDRVGAVLTEVDAAAAVITTRAVDVGVEAVTTSQGIARIWVVRTGCCPACAEYSGSVAPPGGGFRPRATYADGDSQWETPGGGIHGPPIHFHCRCTSIPYAPRVAERLARQTEADVAAGRIAASTPARIRAIERLLADDARLTQRTRERALRAAARGRTAGQRPATPPRRTPSG